MKNILGPLFATISPHKPRIDWKICYIGIESARQLCELWIQDRWLIGKNELFVTYTNYYKSLRNTIDSETSSWDQFSTHEISSQVVRSVLKFEISS